MPMRGRYSEVETVEECAQREEYSVQCSVSSVCVVACCEDRIAAGQAGQAGRV